MGILFYVLLLGVCCLVINKFADLLGENIVKLAIKLKLPPAVRGVLLEGVSSSTPELITSGAAALLLVIGGDETAFADVGIGTIGGSAIFNILIIPFLSILFVPGEQIKDLEIDKKAMLRDLAVYLLSVGILFFASKSGLLTSRVGAFMAGIYIVYAICLIKSSKDSDFEADDDIIVTESLGKLWFNIVAYLAPIGIAVHYCVVSATYIGNELNIPRLIMALIVLAGVTSIPDALLSIRSARNGEMDASIANAVGSNSFDILICLGFIIAIAGVDIKVNFAEVWYIFAFLILSSICYTFAFLFKSGKVVKLALLGLPYIGFIYYLNGLIIW
ncbi:MAG: sodium:calcium antiporter [Cetobacterium sp.]|uniref:sodium:calcium antiporter n=1 Tax=Cetobacterium sp. TaxID=2071632 RepID=UPI003F34200F